MKLNKKEREAITLMRSILDSIEDGKEISLMRRERNLLKTTFGWDLKANTRKKKDVAKFVKGKEDFHFNYFESEYDNIVMYGFLPFQIKEDKELDKKELEDLFKSIDDLIEKSEACYQEGDRDRDTMLCNYYKLEDLIKSLRFYFGRSKKPYTLYKYRLIDDAVEKYIEALEYKKVLDTRQRAIWNESFLITRYKHAEKRINESKEKIASGDTSTLREELEDINNCMNLLRYSLYDRSALLKECNISNETLEAYIALHDYAKVLQSLIDQEEEEAKK